MRRAAELRRSNDFVCRALVIIYATLRATELVWVNLRDEALRQHGYKVQLIDRIVFEEAVALSSYLDSLIWVILSRWLAQ